jgi:hypothetical protein
MKLLLSIAALWLCQSGLAQPSVISPNSTTDATVEASSSPDLVKVYVKQDPATYRKQNDEQPRIDFSVQVAASSRPIAEKTARQEWEGLGPVYIQNENGMYKIRIGPYESQKEAKHVLLEVKSKGRKDAFIVVRQGGQFDKPMDVEETTAVEEETIEVSTVAEATGAETRGDYKVRIASYLHPGGFNADEVDHLGTLESYRKGEWTIMMIGGFKTLEAANRARKEVLAKGFNDAAVVIDRDGILETIIE